MGIWAGIKHSLNSTLGTNEFQPLDKLLRYGSKQFTEGNDIYKVRHLLQFLHLCRPSHRYADEE